jgi:RNA polymerase sigma factor (sigma-70 family)
MFSSTETLVAFRNGDSAVLSEVYKRYTKRVFAFLFKELSSNARSNVGCFGPLKAWEIEDVVQEVFARAFRKHVRWRYDGVRPYENYLFSIARNCVVDLARKAAREQAGIFGICEVLDPCEIRREENRSPEQSLDDKQLCFQLTAFTNGLSDEHRHFFRKRFFEEQSLIKLKKELRMTGHGVQKLERKLRQQFLSHMKKGGYFDTRKKESRIALPNSRQL